MLGDELRERLGPAAGGRAPPYSLAVPFQRRDGAVSGNTEAPVALTKVAFVFKRTAQAGTDQIAGAAAR
jgi:hypothetical protein